MKQTIKNKIRKNIQNIMSIFKIKNIIVFESNADYSDNSRAFYEYLIENGYNKQYKIYWFVNDKNNFKDKQCENVKFITIWKDGVRKTPYQWLKYFYIVKNAKFLISSNRQLHKLNKKTVSININHGTPLKNIKNLNVVSKDVDFSVVASDFCIDLMSDQLNMPKDKFVCLGNPRNDIIFKETNTIEKVKEFSRYDKIIIWLPTFRKAGGSERTDSSFVFPLGLPIIYNEQELVKLNEYLQKNNILILFKLHPHQDASLLKAYSLSNIKILTDLYLVEKNIELTELFKITDALITDYSGVYYDYLLLNRQIGFTTDDFEEYKKQKGFVFDNIQDYMAGEKISDINVLYTFIQDVINNNDKYKKKRNEMKKKFNKYTDSKSSERLAKYLKL